MYMEIKRRMPIGVELVKRGIVTENDIEKALEYQREHPNVKLGDILHILNVCDDEILIKNISEITGEKGILLTSETMKVKPTDYLSFDMCKNNRCLPFEVTNGKIKVAFSDKTVNGKTDPVRMILLNKGLVMEKYLTFENDIDKILFSMEEENAGNDITKVTSSSGTTMIELIDNIIRTGMEKRASDIHIEPLVNEIRVRYRIDGELFTAAKIPKEKQSQVIGRLKAISNMHQEKQESQDGRILLYDDYNIRVSSQPNVYGEKFVLRLLKKDETIKTLYELGYPHDEKLMKDSFDKRNSITIIAAPTGEGKTTTLYSAISYLNRPDVNITTIEDPVEIRIPGLNQIEIDPRTTFAGSLRTVLRQDPNIILVGEIRDKETAEIAMQAGQTGHYVLSTIHTLNAIEVITRLREIGISNYDISSTVATSISQRLIRKLCPECKKERPFTEEEKNIIRKIGEKYNINYDVDNAKTYEAVGCEKCHDSGYFDRTGIFETMIFSETIQQMIIEGKSTIEIRKEALNEGYRPLLLQGIERVLDGTTTLDELNSKLLFY